LEQALTLLSSTLQHLITDQGQAVLEVVRRYARSWRILRDYDENQLSSAPDQTSAPIASLDIDTARETIRALRNEIIARARTLVCSAKSTTRPSGRFCSTSSRRGTTSRSTLRSSLEPPTCSTS